MFNLIRIVRENSVGSAWVVEHGGHREERVRVDSAVSNAELDR